MNKRETGRPFSGSILKWLAILLMFADHVGASLLEVFVLNGYGNSPLTGMVGHMEFWWSIDRILRYIGRSAFPIFCFLLVEGAVHTRDIGKYARRLLVFALVSEIPFDLMYGGTWFYPFHQNVIWTLLIGLFGIHLMEKVRKKQKLWIFLPTAVLIVLVGSALGTVGMVDYYGAGVLTLFVFYFFRGRKWWCFSGQLLALYWVNVELLGGLMYPIRLLGMDFELCQQGLALLSLLPIWLYRGRQGCHTKVFQYSCYAFYPVHMLLLALVLNYVNR